MVAERAILHVDMDAFYASVEQLADPSLKGKPVIVGGDGRRGVVASCSYEARSYGIRSAMPSTQARRLCPSAVFLAGHYDRYEKFSRDLHEVLHEFSPLVEGISLDEAFVDVTGAQKLFGEPEKIAWSIRSRVHSRTGLLCSVGVSTTKHVAKLASVSAKPRASRKGPIGGKGVFVVPATEAIEFLHSLPVRALWGVGPNTAAKLASHGITTVKDVANFDFARLCKLLGEASAQHLHDLSWNLDPRPVEPDRQVKSIGHEETFAQDITTESALHVQLVRLSDAVATRLRKANVAGRTITVKLRTADFRTTTRAKTISAPTSMGKKILEVATELSESADLETGLRLIGISVSNLGHEEVTEQLSLGISEVPVDDRDETLDKMLDQIRERYGSDALMPGVLAGPSGRGVLRRGERQWGPSDE